MNLSRGFKAIFIVFGIIIMICVSCVYEKTGVAAIIKKPKLVLTTTENNQEIWLKWRSVKSADKYEIYRADKKKGTYKKKKTVSKNSF